MFFGGYGSTVMNEALTEHLAQSLAEGDLDIVRPHDRKREGAYIRYREFLDVLINGGRTKIDIRELYDVFYFSQQEDLRSLEQSDKVQRLLAKLNDSFGGVNIRARIMDVRSEEDLERLMTALLVSVRSDASVASAGNENRRRDEELVAAVQSWGDEFDANK